MQFLFFFDHSSEWKWKEKKSIFFWKKIIILCTHFLHFSQTKSCALNTMILPGELVSFVENERNKENRQQMKCRPNTKYKWQIKSTHVICFYLRLPSKLALWYIYFLGPAKQTINFAEKQSDVMTIFLLIRCKL